jgi:hypothetical protein
MNDDVIDKLNKIQESIDLNNQMVILLHERINQIERLIVQNSNRDPREIFNNVVGDILADIIKKP